ncbi:transcription factor BIM1 isoform X6 [Jatropha curcas]|uniref:transcription factor BIM1 isoform X6 n=1 Tax=Jatropha curcas TaxID=180498 RepID=UPI0005FC3278|nr:transcription factor BIM1 isoform X6 [Jatropha curcas]
MELPQQQRLFESEGRKPTHDFLSLYSHSTVQQDPRPPSQGYLKTHDFLQPLERVGKTTATKEETGIEISSLERPPPPAPPPSVEHILPGGIGTYSISHISNYFNQRIPKPEGSTMFSVAQASSTDKNDEHSNCSSYTGSGFSLWEESQLKKGKTGKENEGERSNTVREAAATAGHWTSSERPSQSSTNNHRNSFSPLSSSQPSGQKSHSFMEMIKSAKGSTQDDNLDDEEEFVLKKESSSPVHKGELRVKVDGKSTDQKANTPRSKHSATEQRRRSKINDRFQMLRELIPHGDQKRDKASFLLEEKVQKYEGSYQGWNHEPAKLVPWPNFFNSGRSGGIVNQLPPRMVSDAENIANQPQPQSHNTRLCTSDGAVAADKLKEQELSIEGGTINISSVYSQGLLNTLTQALQSSGVDLSLASISVQIQLGKRANRRPILPTSIVKDNEVPCSNQGTTRPRVSDGEESGQALKKLKTSKTLCPS